MMWESDETIEVNVNELPAEVTEGSELNILIEMWEMQVSHPGFSK